ncbi:MAG: hypothetical protein OEY78_07545 [Gammaproteobacteria bacterium]|nr:hypothetical protein [Gammaproteobacteria bacterium]
MFFKTYRPVKTLLTLFLVSSTLLLNGCATSPDPIDPKDKNRSVVFGYFDMEDAPSWGGIDWVSVKQYKPRTKKGYYGAAVKEGLFYHIGLPNGSFQVDSFGRNTRFYSNTRYTYNFGGKGRNQTARVIKRPGVYFMGSYKYKAIDSGSIFKPDNFKMIKSKKPKEKVLLKKLLKIMQSDSDLAIYTYQIHRIKQRLKKLK